MVEKVQGGKMNCLNCGAELICGWSKPSGGYAPKLQWQNQDKTAHFTRFDGSKYVCPVEKESERPDVPQTIPVRNSPREEFTKPQKTSEQKMIEAIGMVDLLWKPALEKAKEVYKIPATVTEPQTNKDVMILSQVFFKAMVENYNK